MNEEKESDCLERKRGRESAMSAYMQKSDVDFQNIQKVYQK